MVDKKVTSFKIERHHSHSWSYEYTIDGKHRDIIGESLPDLKKKVFERGFPWKYKVSSFEIKKLNSLSWCYEYILNGEEKEIYRDSVFSLKLEVEDLGLPWDDNQLSEEDIKTLKEEEKYDPAYCGDEPYTPIWMGPEDGWI